MQKVYYNIREASEMTGVNPSTLRYWERVFPALNPHLSADSTRRYYSDADIELIKKIKYLREVQHLHILAVKKELDYHPHKVNFQQKNVERLQKLRQLLIDLRAQL